ncbi:hypothetical protein X975_19236, partial [Stegodyphus mimosarum]
MIKDVSAYFKTHYTFSCMGGAILINSTSSCDFVTGGFFAVLR